jgi:hypothetical protein
MSEILAAGEAAYSEPENLCAWAKSNGGMGTFYRSRHELVFAFKVGTAPHINNFELGHSGLYRTNVWETAGANCVGRDRDEAQAMHPTVKPVALVADAIRDCSRRRQIVLDPFAGSDTTVIAAEKTGRRARVLELDPIYCDTIIRRWAAFKESNMRDGKHKQNDQVEGPNKPTRYARGRWLFGHCPNPMGRPRKATKIDEDKANIGRFGQAEVEMKVGGEIMTMTRREALLFKMYEGAMGCKVQIQKFSYEPFEQRDKDIPELTYE